MHIRGFECSRGGWGVEASWIERREYSLAIFGSVADRLLKETRLPVLVLRPA